jgi:PKHD-type hydroxylase
MIYSFKKDNVENWMFAENLFTNEECQKVIEYGSSLEKKDAETNDEKYNKKNNIRKSKVAWIDYNENSAWIYEKINHAVCIINEKCFHFDLTGVESMQFAEYNAPDDHFSTHIDKEVNTPVIKLSLSVQLSAPEDYEGGELEIVMSDQGVKMPKTKGTVIAFPSYAPHKINPITKGKRYSLVVWVTGPNFK